MRRQSMSNDSTTDDHITGVFNRREFIRNAIAASAALPLVGDAAVSSPQTSATTADATSPVMMQLRVNQQAHMVCVDIRTTLLDALRDHVGLTGTKKGCGHGQCGA